MLVKYSMLRMKKIKVLLLFGGESPEHEVSMVSAKNVYRAIDKQKYQVFLCYIDKKGTWHEVDAIRPTHKGDKRLSAGLGNKVFYVGSHEITPDVILPILHGQNGEDGTIQGFANLMHIPIAGPSLVSSVVAMDKDITKKLLTTARLPVVDWVIVHKSLHYPAYDVVARQLGDVLFVKPASTGSSVGVSKVRTPAEYDKAVRLAFEYGDKIIIESAINEAREIEVAVIGNSTPKATAAGEIIPGQDFYSYDDKYDDTSSALVKVPADLSKTSSDEIKRMSLQAYKAIEGHGMARIDFFLTGDGKIYINEVNTIPGFTDISMYPKLWQHMGLEYTDLIDRLLQFALEE